MMKNYLKNEPFMIEASKPKSKSTKKSYLLLIKKRKIIMITFGMLTLRISEKILQKIEEPCEQKLQGALFLAIENKSAFSQLSIPAPILTTMTKSEPVISTLENMIFRVSYGKIFCLRKNRFDWLFFFLVHASYDFWFLPGLLTLKSF